MNIARLNTTADDKVFVKGNAGGGGNSGGGELEGEYYLAKPNGRYWKFKFSKKTSNGIPFTLLEDLTNEERETIVNVIRVFQYGFAYTCFANSEYSMISSSTFDELYIDNPFAANIALGKAYTALKYNITPSWADKIDYCVINAIQECNGKLPKDIADVIGVSEIDFLTFIKLSFSVSMEGTLTDDEAMAMIQNMLMLEPVTKEEYESWIN